LIIDLHTHTRPRSDDSDLDPSQLITLAKRSGLDGICFTEHDWHWSVEDVERLSGEHDFRIFRGMEISSDEGHLLVFGLEEYRFGMHHADEVRRLVDEAGGVVILAHPFRRKVRYNSNPEGLFEDVCRDRIFDLVDAIEVMNGGSTARENRFAQDIGSRLKLRGTGGSDAHAPGDIPSYATEFEKRIETLSELIEELRAGRFRAVSLK